MDGQTIVAIQVGHCASFAMPELAVMYNVGLISTMKSFGLTKAIEAIEKAKRASHQEIPTTTRKKYHALSETNCFQELRRAQPQPHHIQRQMHPAEPFTQRTKAMGYAAVSGTP